MAKKETGEDILRAIMEKGGKGGGRAQQAAAEALNDAAESIKENTRQQAKIGETLGNVFNNFKNSFSSAGGGGRGTGDGTGGLGGLGGGGRRNNVPNILLDILNVNRSILKFTHSNNDVLYDILDAIRGNERSKIEERRERSTRTQPTEGTGAGIGKTLTGAGNLFGGMGNLLSGLGGGLGKLLGGAGIAAFLLSEADAEKIKKNIETLLSIGEGYESKLDFLKEGGTLALMLYGIGTGLSTFAIGQFANVITQWTTGFLGKENWAETVKDNVADLLEIANLPNSNVGNVAWLTTALVGIGTGLAVFGIGKGVEGGIEGIVKGIDFFTKDQPFAQRLKDELGTLLSIADLPHQNDAGWLAGALTKIGLGLSVFALGKGLEGIAYAGQEIVDFFTGQQPFAQRIYDEVKTLLSIADIPHASDDVTWFANMAAGITAGLGVFALGKGLEGGVNAITRIVDFFAGQQPFADRIYNEVKTLLSIADIPHASENVNWFADAMAGITAGLGVFALGKGLEGGVNAVTKIIDFFTGDKPFAQRIYDEVSKLLSITKIDADGKSFFLTMSDIAAGLAAFTVSDFASSLVNVGTSILNFISGKSSPFDKIKELANDADKLEKGANALEKIANALSTFSNIKTGNLGDIDFEGMAKNLGQAIPLLNALANGGTLSAGGLFSWLKSDLDFGKGILDPNLKLDQMASAISKINYVLGRTTDITPVQGNAQNVNAATRQNAVDGESQGNNIIVVPPANGTSNASREPPMVPRSSGAVQTAPVPSLFDRHMYDSAYFGAGHP
jgi:hypothetical protein